LWWQSVANYLKKYIESPTKMCNAKVPTAGNEPSDNTHQKSKCNDLYLRPKWIPFFHCESDHRELADHIKHSFPAAAQFAL